MKCQIGQKVKTKSNNKLVKTCWNQSGTITKRRPDLEYWGGYRYYVEFDTPVELSKNFESKGLWLPSDCIQ